MPRATYKINDFSGGLSDDSDPRDIRDNELVSAKDINVDKIGKIRIMGSVAIITSPDWNTIIASATSQAAIGNVTIGYGLSIFASDYHTTGSSGDKNFLVLSGLSTTGSAATTNKKYFISRIWEDDGVAFDGTITVNSNTNQTVTGTFEPNYYYADGGLRICDGNFSNTSSVNKWFGYIKRTHFASIPENYDDYYDKTNNLAAPTKGVFGVGIYGSCTTVASDTVTLKAGNAAAFTGIGTELNGVYLAVNHTDGDSVVITTRDSNQQLTTAAVTSWSDGDTYFILPPAGTGFNLSLGVAGTAGQFGATGSFELASTFIYDDVQESKPFEMIGNFSITDTSNSILTWVTVKNPFDPRISGGRIYIREENTNDEWLLFLDIDLKDGIRANLIDEYYNWDDINGGGFYIPGNLFPLIKSFNVDTYGSLSGIDDTEKDITAKYKAAVVTNRIAYLGNVRINNKNFEDSIFKSFVNRFDTVTEDRRLDVAINDGDAIVKLETFADRILEYKKKTVYVINIAQEVEFLENEYKYLGIDYPYQVIITEFGPAWINTKGCYLYTGKGVVDLLLDPQDPRRRKIALSTWTNFLGTNPSVGYDASNKKLMVFSELSGADIDIYLYDFTTGSWTLGVDKYDQASANYSNPITDWDGDLIVFNDNDDEIYKWSNTPTASANFEIRTKDFDGGLPGIKKILYKVIITYKGTGGATATNVQVRYDTNGGTSFGKDFTPESNATLDGTISELDPASAWTAAVLVPDTNSESHDIRSWALKFFPDSGQNVDAAFEINDINYIFRTKGNR